MKAIIELQKRAMDSSTDIVELVSYAYAIARKLYLQDFVDWCNAELNGYSENSAVPEYRIVRGIAEVQFLNGLIQPLQCKDSTFIEKISKMYIPYNIKYLVDVLKEDESGVTFTYPSKIEQNLRKGMNHNSYISNIYLRVMAAEIKRIFSVITQTILDWTLECEKQGILGEELDFTGKEKEMAQNTNYHIGSVQNMANNNQDTTIHQNSQKISIVKGDFTSLANFLTRQGMSEPDIQELKEIIEIEPNLATEGMNNHKIQSWIGKIATKIASGTKVVATGVTVEVIVKALGQFF